MPKENSLITTRQNYDRLSRWYDLFSSSEQRLTRLGLRLLNIQTGERVLEIGFGTGRALVELASTVGELGNIYGIDISPGMIAVAHRRVRHSSMGERIFLQVADATHLPYHDHQFNAVFLSFTLELFDTMIIPVVLAECQRVIQPGDRLGIVSLARKDTLAVEIYDWFHIHFPILVDCSPISVSPLLEGAGFEIFQIAKENMWGLPVDVVIARKP
jgi:ubiquinone/menaquinone biosynthesis C-methylase UbiE